MVSMSVTTLAVEAVPAAEGHRRRGARYRHAVIEVRGAARLPVIQSDRRPINGDLFLARVGDVGHGEGQPRDGLPRFHRRDGCPTEQPHRRVPFGEGRGRCPWPVKVRARH